MRLEVKKCLKMLIEKGYLAYLVGGYPRDYCLHRESNDYDICTNAPKEIVKDLFPNVIDENFGSSKILFEGCQIEITTFRKELRYVGTRTPIIEYTDELREDLHRRDFIMNTLCMDGENHFIDLLGALTDIEDKKIQSVGNPYQKMEEDPLRILRAIRFATTLDFNIEDTLWKAMEKHCSLVAHLSNYRKREELDKIFESPNFQKGISLIQKIGMEPYLGCSFDSLVYVPDVVGMWSQVSIVEDYPFSKEEKRKMEILQSLLKESMITDFHLYRYGLYLCTLATQIRKEDISLLKDRYAKLPIYKRQDIAISADDIKRITTTSLAAVYSCLEKKILEGKLSNQFSELSHFIEKYFE